MLLTSVTNDAVAGLMREAAERFILPRYRKLSSEEVAEKAAKDFVTVADRESEACLLPELARLIAGSIGIGEESVYRVPALLDRLRDETVWLVDPLDGTSNFVEGRPDFAVMTSLLRRGKAVACWIYFPISGAMIEAHHGAGTTIDGRAAICSGNPVPGKARGAIIQAGMPADIGDRLRDRAGELDPRSGERFCAAAECLALIRGDLDFGIYWRTLPWDHAPCCLAIREAGGSCRRFDGAEYEVADGRSGLIVAAQDGLGQRLGRWLEGPAQRGR
jgi:fructose-1,6-bisphosphatase/inositol monophosphatase family enzyme